MITCALYRHSVVRISANILREGEGKGNWGKD